MDIIMTDIELITPIDVMQKTAQRAKALRLAQNITQQELADKVGVSRPMIGQIERGSRVPSVVLGRDIAKALGVSVEDLLK